MSRLKALLGVIALTLACLVALVGATPAVATPTCTWGQADMNPNSDQLPGPGFEPNLICFGSYEAYSDALTGLANAGGHHLATLYANANGAGTRLALIDANSSNGCGVVDYRADVLPGGWANATSAIQIVGSACTNDRFYAGLYLGNSVPGQNGNPNAARAQMGVCSPPAVISLSGTSMNDDTQSLSLNNNSTNGCGAIIVN